MDFELTIYELGKILNKLGEEYKLSILTKVNLSGGWMTINGDAFIEKIPTHNVVCKSKGNNIISIRVKTDNSKEGAIMKLTGAKNKKFKVNIAETRYKEFAPNKLTLNKIKINNKECKLRIDDDIIFTINASLDEIKNKF